MLEGAQLNLSELNNGLISCGVYSEQSEQFMRAFANHLKTKWPSLRVMLFKHHAEQTQIEEI